MLAEKDLTAEVWQPVCKGTIVFVLFIIINFRYSRLGRIDYNLDDIKNMCIPLLSVSLLLVIPTLN